MSEIESGGRAQLAKNEGHGWWEVSMAVIGVSVRCSEMLTAWTIICERRHVVGRLVLRSGGGDCVLKRERRHFITYAGA